MKNEFNQIFNEKDIIGKTIKSFNIEFSAIKFTDDSFCILTERVKYGKRGRGVDDMKAKNPKLLYHLGIITKKELNKRNLEMLEKDKMFQKNLDMKEFNRIKKQYNL